MFSLPSNRFITVLHVVSHWCSGSCDACPCLCPLSVLMCVPSFVNLGLHVDSIVFNASVIVGDVNADLISKC